MSQTTHSALTLCTPRPLALTLTLTLAALLTAAALTACGGGGGDTEPVPGPPPTPTPEPTPTPFSAIQLQGRWLTSSGITPSRTAIVLPGSTTAGTTASMDLWLLASDLSSLSRLQVSTSGTDGVSATGKTYSLPSSATNPGQSATYSGTANLSNNTLSLNAGTLLLTRSDTLLTPSHLADVVGNWQGSVGGETVTVNLNLAASGALSGSSSTGCSYSGTLAARSDASAYNASLTEVCSTGTASFAGIATYRAPQAPTPAALTLALTSTDAAQTQALVLGLQR